MRIVLIALCLLALSTPGAAEQSQDPALNQKLIETLTKQRNRAAIAAEQQKKADEAKARAKNEDEPTGEKK